ncbi:MAG: LPS export ABC transporter permease LptF [Pseudomonadota bacterium]
MLKPGLIDRYIFRQVFWTFLGMLVALTVLIVCVVALQELDIVTNQGAALATFAVLTLYSMPALISVVAPIALFLALLLTLNRLSGESEVIVLNASGGSPLQLFRPVAIATLLVSILVGIIAHLIAPPAQASWRVLVSEARADLLSSAIREGSFVSLRDGLTFHMRNREPGGVLADIMIADTSEHPEELVYLAKRGRIVRAEEGSFLAVEDGVIQRRTQSESGRISKASLYFDTYAIDLSFADSSGAVGFFKPSERSTAYLLNPEADDPFFVQRPGRFAAELHNRMALPLFPFAFAMIVVVALGTPHSTRAGRGQRVFAAAVAAGAVMGAQFGTASLIATAPVTWPLLYALPIMVFVAGLVLLVRGAPTLGSWRPNLPFKMPLRSKVLRLEPNP